VVERGIDAREIEIAVLGDGGPDTLVSAPGEIILPPGLWYDYDTKYVSDVASLAIPAAFDDPAIPESIVACARTAFRVTGCHGLARIDFLLDRATGRAYLNELNTMPGFTSISMYPKLMADAGVPYPALIDRLCALALQRHAERRALRHDL
jgi:D-alanine-D-alanine ligase